MHVQVRKVPVVGQRRRRDGPTSEQIDEVTAMFGEDYDEYEDEEDEEEEGKSKIEYGDKYSMGWIRVVQCVNGYKLDI